MINQLACVLVLLCLPFVAVQADSVLVYTEDNPPYNFRTSDGSIDGVSVRLVRQVMDETGLNYEIRLVSWVRAMRNAQLLDNALIFSIVQVESRMPKFHWLVPLINVRGSLYGRHDDMRRVTMEGIRQGQFTAVCPAKSVECEVMRTIGFPEKNIFSIALAAFGEQYQIVQTHRVDFMIADPLNYPYYTMNNDEGYAASDFREIMQVGPVFRSFLASGKHIKPDIKEAVLSAYARLQARGEYQMITVESARKVVKELMQK